MELDRQLLTGDAPGDDPHTFGHPEHLRRHQDRHTVVPQLAVRRCVLALRVGVDRHLGDLASTSRADEVNRHHSALLLQHLPGPIGHLDLHLLSLPGIEATISHAEDKSTDAVKDHHYLFGRTSGNDPRTPLVASLTPLTEVNEWVTGQAVLDYRQANKGRAKIVRFLSVARQLANQRFEYLAALRRSAIPHRLRIDSWEGCRAIRYWEERHRFPSQNVSLEARVAPTVRLP